MGCIIISPTRELAAQTFSVLNKVGKFHKFSAGLLIGGREGVDVEKERVNEMNILVCAPGRLLQHMDETPNFECSHLQVLIMFSLPQTEYLGILCFNSIYNHCADIKEKNRLVGSSYLFLLHVYEH